MTQPTRTEVYYGSASSIIGNITGMEQKGWAVRLIIHADEPARMYEEWVVVYERDLS